MDLIPDDAIKIALTLVLSFVIGLEREEHRTNGKEHYIFGGVRTFPLLGLMGYLFARLSNGEPLVIAIGFVTIGSLMWLSYQRKIQEFPVASLTTEVTGLFTFVIGSLVFDGAYWMATTMAVIAVLLLELKHFLEDLAHKISAGEIFTFAKFLLLTGVILPIVPNQEFTPFNINPYNVWLVVVAISALSYAGYGISHLLGPKPGVMASALLGGLYSSTLTTVLLAKRSQGQQSSRLLSGAILTSSGVMYLRMGILIALFNSTLAAKLTPAFVILAALTCLVGWAWSRTDTDVDRHDEALHTRNPLELGVAVIFAGIFVLLTVLTQLARDYVGTTAVFSLAALSGFTDVDAITMSLTQGAGKDVALEVAAKGIILAAASNNFIKAGYAYFWGSGKTRIQGALFLVGLGVIGSLLFFVL